MKKKDYLFDYAMVIMFSSYFQKERLHKGALAKLYMNYQEVRKEEQYQAEQTCERYLRRYILPNLPRTFLSGMVDVTVKYLQCREILCFTDGIHMLELCVLPPKNGRGLSVWHRVTVCEE